jgi:hypothetical protein
MASPLSPFALYRPEAMTNRRYFWAIPASRKTAPSMPAWRSLRTIVSLSDRSVSSIAELVVFRRRTSRRAGLREIPPITTSTEQLRVSSELDRMDGIRLVICVSWGIQIVTELMGAPQGMGQVFSMAIPMQALDLIIAGILWITLLAATTDLLFVWFARAVTRWVPVHR